LSVGGGGATIIILYGLKAVFFNIPFKSFFLFTTNNSSDFITGAVHGLDIGGNLKPLCALELTVCNVLISGKEELKTLCILSRVVKI